MVETAVLSQAIMEVHVRKKRHGHAFEDQVVIHLYRSGAMLERDQVLDAHLGVDFSIRRFPETELPKALDVQLTFQDGNIEKLARFRDRKVARDTLRAYVIAADGMSADEAAHLIRVFIFAAARDGTFERQPMSGVMLAKDGSYCLFDIDQRLEMLRKLADPVLSADRRILGRVVSIGKKGPAVLGADGRSRYRIRLGDVADHNLKVMLDNPEIFWGQLVERDISFIPEASYATSVMLTPA